MKHERRAGALARLESQQSSGVKPEKIDGKTTGKMVKFTEKDTKRIEREITILKKRV